jgi:uncharacterized hydrophobic protein (TIGR00271 family)
LKELPLIRKLLNYINLESEVDDYDNIHQTIEKDIIFKGTNLWILMFAIVVASVGLNMNSTAVIIGAMLISPLMGPINGMGYSISTYNFPLLRKAFKNFTFAVIASLVSSTSYFAITPISTAHSELLARTSPTIYDVLIALFGGLAGIVAISSKRKGNVIPGVAIATALMPPLCTAGYGIATGQFYYFLGAFYLFTINTVFIAISSILISQILKFPIRTIVDESQKRKVNRYITVVILLTIIPSIYFGYNLIEKEKFSERANLYIRNISVVEGTYLLKNEVNPGTKAITLVYGGSPIAEEKKKELIDQAKFFGLNEAEINIQQGFTFDFLTEKTSQVENLTTELNRMRAILQVKEKQIDSLARRSYLGQQLLKEIQILYPQITTCSYSETQIFHDTIPNPEKIALIVFNTPGINMRRTDQEKIEDWIKTRLNTEKVKVYFENRK